MAPLPDRITKLSLGKFNQVIAVTQEMINAGLEGQFLLTVARAKKAGKDLHFNFNLRTGTIVNGLLNFPQVIVGTSPGNSSSVIYILYFKEGVANLYSSDEVQVPDVQLPLTGQFFGFSVNLGLAGIEDKDKEAELRKLINVPGNYTIKQLALDLNTASIINFNERFTSDRINQLTTYEKNGLSSLMQRVITSSAALTSLGYGVSWDIKTMALGFDEAELQGIPNPTFLPTYQSFQTYPWIDPSISGYEPHSGLTGNDRLNYLCYKEMTGGRAAPPRQDEILLPSGNWTDGTAPVGKDVLSTSLGTFAMSKTQFLEGWFLPKLRKFNQVMESSISGMDINLDIVDFKLIKKWAYAIGVGANQSHPNLSDRYFDWKAGTEPQDPTLPRQYTFESNSRFAPVWKSVTYLLYNVTITGDCYTESKNTVAWVPGTDLVTLRGKSATHLYAMTDSGQKRADSITYESNWSIDFHLQSVSDGGLQINMELPAEPSGQWTEKSFEANLLNRGDTASTNYVMYIEERHSVAFKYFSQVQSDLINELNSTQKFTLPAAGSFFYKDPVLNHDGALLCNIFYNGDEAQAGNPNPEAPARRVVTVTPDPFIVPAPKDVTVIVG